MQHRGVGQRRERGMSTAEYTVGTLGAVSIAGLLVSNNPISDFVTTVFREAVRIVVAGEVEDVLTLPRLIMRAVGDVLPW
ncbi:DUF4244 domain-containing protein [Aeromicrobium sp. YIM 150415]|mgnify:CR=1 FL=1|uniref:DUF4244 domain-containing protein n=1 Tax=Aeromicrobium sp. YIM 150415 TaxID=2803912 RepID=UPI0019665A72|nr:DUF4244 domain-containing protein [Aeromicrobium sp. YIM 150415]MBM9464112.1 DUF4244 domain-containing protein [Aeromicrobium sp. YIM 150415]